MLDQKEGGLRRWSHIMTIVLLTVLVSGALMLWAWNTIAVELFQAPEIRFKHVLAFQAAVAALTALPLVVARRLRHDGTNAAT